MPYSDPVLRSQYHRRYYREHKKVMLDQSHARYLRKQPEILAQKQNYWKINAAAIKERRQRLRAERRLRLLIHYGGGQAKCVCCNEGQIQFLSIDHIANNGAEHRRTIGIDRLHQWLEQNGYPEGYQTLCMNCNWGKHRNGGICPHKQR